VDGVTGTTISGKTVFITPKTRTWAQQFRGVLQRKIFSTRLNATAVKTLYPKQRCATLFRTFSKKGGLTMADYISREAAEKTLIEYFLSSHISETFIKDVVKQIPAADVRPAKKAMCEVEGNGWTEHVMEYTDWRCHACGGFWTVCAGIGEAFDKYSFCPRCGAELT
jgi:hypothetical protein